MVSIREAADNLNKAVSATLLTTTIEKLEASLPNLRRAQIDYLRVTATIDAENAEPRDPDINATTSQERHESDYKNKYHPK